MGNLEHCFIENEHGKKKKKLKKNKKGKMNRKISLEIQRAGHLTYMKDLSSQAQKPVNPMFVV